MNRNSKKNKSRIPSRQASSGEVQPFIVNNEKLRQIETRPPFIDYLIQLHQRRHFILLDAKTRAFSSNKDLKLGKLWIVAKPLLNALLYGLMFGFILQTSRGIENFVGFLVIGITFFGFLTSLLNQGTGILRNSRGMISAFRFPKAALIFSVSYRELLDSIPSAIIAILVALLMQFSTPITWTILLVIPLFLLLHIFGTGLMFIGARITAQVPDFRVLIQLGGRAWFFVSGVFFSIDRFVNHPELKALMEANPAYVFLTALREATMYGIAPDLLTWLVLFVWSLGTFSIGFLLFWQGEARYIGVK